MENSSLKILVVTSIYPTQQNPSLGAFVASQVQSLQNIGLSIDVIFLDVRRSKWELLKGITKIRNRLSSNTYDLIHAHFGYNGIPVCFQKNLPFVISFCGSDLNHPGLRKISRWVAKHADACIVKSKSLLELLGQPAVVIPNGIDLELFRPNSQHSSRRRLGLYPEGRYALFASNPSRPEKQYELAKSALTIACQSGVACQPLILQNQPPSEVPHYLNAANLLLLTSRYEGSPNVVKEAMACNLPIVSTEVGDVPQILKNTHNCTICKPTAESLAKGVQTVLKHGIPSNGRSKIGHLSSDIIAAKVLDVYHQVLEKRNKP